MTWQTKASRKWLPQNTEQTRKQAWAAVTQLLLPDLGKFYSRFYPASQPWGQDISAPYSVVLGREDPVTFLNVVESAVRQESPFCHSQMPKGMSLHGLITFSVDMTDQGVPDL